MSFSNFFLQRVKIIFIQDKSYVGKKKHSSIIKVCWTLETSLREGQKVLACVPAVLHRTIMFRNYGLGEALCFLPRKMFDWGRLP